MPTPIPYSAIVRKHWFLLGMVAVVALAAVWPAPARAIKAAGLLRLLIALIFLNSGLSIPTRRLLDGIRDARSFLSIQGFNFVLFPVAMGASARLFFAGQDATWQGMALLMAVPTTIASCVVLTNVAGGATGVALVSAVAGNLLGVVVSPLLLKIALGVGSSLDVTPMILMLLWTVLAPVALGQALRPLAPAFFAARGRDFRLFNQAVILVIIFTAAARAIPHFATRPLSVLGVMVYLVAFHAALMALARAVARASGGDPRLAPAIVFCGVQKTLAIGQALAAPLAVQLDANEGLLMAPLILYHLIQLVMDSWAAQRWKLTKNRSKEHSETTPQGLAREA